QDRVPLPKVRESFRAAQIHLYKKDLEKLEPLPITQWLEDDSPLEKLQEEDPTFKPEVKLGPLEKVTPVKDGGSKYSLAQGSVVIAAITSCTNTSNPQVLMAAGL